MAKKTHKSSLLTALEFISLAQRDVGAPYQTHVTLRDKTAVAHDGTLSVGHLIEEDLIAYPHTLTLLAALRKVEDVLSVTQLSNMKLAVRSGKFKALVPCVTDAALPNIRPDPMVGAANNNVREGFKRVVPLVVENSQHVSTSAVFLHSGSVVATNTKVLLEYWHGIEFDFELLLPKLFVDAVIKITKNIIGYGFSPNTFTLYFEDSSWIKTQVYVDKYLNYGKILNVQSNQQPIPTDFFKALNTVHAFAPDYRVWLKNGYVSTSANDYVGATFEVSDLNTNVVCNIRHLLLLEDFVTTFDFAGVNNVSHFFGENIRGAMSHFKG